MAKKVARSDQEEIVGPISTMVRDVRITRPFASTSDGRSASMGRNLWRDIMERYGSRFERSGSSRYVWLRRALEIKQEILAKISYKPRLHLALLSSRASIQNGERRITQSNHTGLNLNRETNHSHWHVRRLRTYVAAGTHISQVHRLTPSESKQNNQLFVQQFQEQHQRWEQQVTVAAARQPATGAPLIYTRAQQGRLTGGAAEDSAEHAVELSKPMGRQWRESEPESKSTGSPLPAEELNRVTSHVMNQINHRLSAYRERTGRI